MVRLRTSPGVLCLLGLALVASGCTGKEAPGTGSPFSSGASGPGGAQVAAVAPKVPAPPTPMTLPADDDLARIQALADAFEQPGDGRAPALLAAFALLKIPVVNDTEKSVTTPGDVVGIPWALVWSIANTPNEGARFSLAQASAVVAADGVSITEPAALAAGMAAAMHASLRRSGVDKVTLLAALVREETMRVGGPDLQAEAVPADQLQMSLPTMSLLVSAGVLTMMSTLTATPKPSASRVAQISAAPPQGCAEDSASQWALWAFSKVTGGVDLGKRKWDGLFTVFMIHMGATGAPAGTIEKLKAKVGKTANAAAAAAAALTALTTLAAILSYKADVNLSGSGPLKRTRSTTSPGEERNVEVRVSYDLSKLSLRPDQVQALNCLMVVLSAFGNNATLPNTGPIPDVEVQAEGIRGFFRQGLNKGSFMENIPVSASSDDTNADGYVAFPVEGRAQKRPPTKPEPTLPRIFSVRLSTQLDPTNLNTLAKAFLDTVLCAVPVVATKSPAAILGCVDPVADVAKQMQWSLGDFSFDALDYESGEFRLLLTQKKIPNNSPAASGGPRHYDDIDAVVQGCIDDNGFWILTGTYTVTNTIAYPQGPSIDTFKGYLLDMKGAQEPPKAVVELGYFPTPEQQLALGPEVNDFPSYIRLTNPETDRPSAAITFYNALDQLAVKDFPLVVTPQTPKC